MGRYAVTRHSLFFRSEREALAKKCNVRVVGGKAPQQLLCRQS
jgi:hypothetical protein